MKKKLLQTISTISLALLMFVLPCISTYKTSDVTKQNTDLVTQTRTVSAASNGLDLENSFSEFEDGTLEITQETVSIEGFKTFKLSDLTGVDLVANSNIEEDSVQFKYSVDYDNVTNEVALSIVLAGETTTENDKLVGFAFINEDGNIDAEFDCDGEIIYLSEMQELGMIENCSLFSRLWNSVKKAVSTNAGKIITAATAVTCVAVGVVCAVVAAPIATAVIIGAAVGAVGLASAAAVSTTITDGQTDWQAIFDCALVGGVIGGLSSAISYGSTKLIMTAIERVKVAKSISNIEPNRKNHILQAKHNWNKIGGGWDNVSKAIKYVINNGTEAVYKNGVATILTATYQGQKIQVVINVIDGILKIVDAWIC